MSDLEKYLKILGVNSTDSLVDIKSTYINLVKENHPDRFTHDPELQQQAEAKLKQYNEAYRYIRDNFKENTSSTTSVAEEIKVSPQQRGAEAYYEDAVASTKQRQYEDAIHALNIAVKINPNYAKAYQLRGHLNSLLGFEIRAEADLVKAETLGISRRRPEKSTQGKTKTSQNKPKISQNKPKVTQNKPKISQNKPKVTQSQSSLSEKINKKIENFIFTLM